MYYYDNGSFDISNTVSNNYISNSFPLFLPSTSNCCNSCTVNLDIVAMINLWGSLMIVSQLRKPWYSRLSCLKWTEANIFCCSINNNSSRLHGNTYIIGNSKEARSGWVDDDSARICRDAGQSTRCKFCHGNKKMNKDSWYQWEYRSSGCAALLELLPQWTVKGWLACEKKRIL